MSRKKLQEMKGNKQMQLKKSVFGSTVVILSMAGIAYASNQSVGVDVNTPNVRVQVGTPAPPPPRVTVVERERVIVHERAEYHDQGKHKGHYKKHKKNKKQKKHHDNPYR